jgi:hypothetical protein
MISFFMVSRINKFLVLDFAIVVINTTNTVELLSAACVLGRIVLDRFKLD